MKITVLVPSTDGYRVHGEFAVGATATSLLLAGLSVDVAAAFAAGNGPLVA